MAFGHPDSASPFVQVKLPTGMTWGGKKSRCVSFVPKDGPAKHRGTNKTQQQAVGAVASWAWSWWESLSEGEQKAVETSARVAASKRVAEETPSSSSKKSRA